MLPIRYKDLDPDAAALVEAALPASATELVRLIGLPATLALICEFGGMEFVFPKKEDGPAAAFYAHIAEAIGHEQTKALAAHFYSNEKVYVPRAARAMAILRNRQIVTDFDQLTKTMGSNRAVNILTQRYRMSGRALEKIVNGKERPSRAKSPTEPQ
ncbi:MAG TPA: Mor transcription activator family protein [Azonexus sp.]|nr:Mor transcription activator family protein [Azonexus sp.]